MIDERVRYERSFEQFSMPEPAWDRLLRRRDRKRRSQRIAAGVVGIGVVVVVAVALIVGTRGGQDSTSPANPPPTTVKPADPAAQGIAQRFFEAYSHPDVDLAINYLADDTAVSGWGLAGIREFRLTMQFWEATGFRHILDSCEITSSSDLGTVVRCTYDFHGLRSKEIGRGPYSGAFDEITVLGEKVVHVSGQFEIAEFSPQMWEPFIDWVSTNHPEDVEVMYNSTLTEYRLTRESIRLWEQHTREYVDAVREGTA